MRIYDNIGEKRAIKDDLIEKLYQNIWAQFIPFKKLRKFFNEQYIMKIIFRR